MSEKQIEKLPEKLEGGEWTRPLFTAEQERIGSTVWWEVTTPTDGCTFHTYGYAATQELSVLFAVAPRMLKALQKCVKVLEFYQQQPHRAMLTDSLHLRIKVMLDDAIAASGCRKEPDYVEMLIAKAKEVTEQAVRVSDVPLRGKIELAADDSVQLALDEVLGGTWITVSAMSGVQT